MNNENIFGRLQEIFRDIFDNNELIISNKTSFEDIESWDSLNHILLLNVVEKEFNIKINLAEMQDTNDVSSIVNLIINKI